MLVGDFFELLLVEQFGFRFLDNVAAIADAVCVVIPRNDVGFADLARPPTERR